MYYFFEFGIVIVEVFCLLKFGGVLIIVDFKFYNFDFLRNEFVYLWLGFFDDDVVEWVVEVGFIFFDVREFLFEMLFVDKKLMVGFWKVVDLCVFVVEFGVKVV